MKYKVNKLKLLFLLYNIEDQRGYNCPIITKKIDKLQKEDLKKLENATKALKELFKED